MAPDGGGQASSGNPSDSKEEASFGTPKQQVRIRLVIRNNTGIHREDDENRNLNRDRIENQEEDEKTAPIKAEEEGGNDNQPLASQSQHVCEHCGSGFSSVEALRGHMRIHGKNKRSCHGSLNLDKNEKSYEHTCYVCPRKFSSSKALHGHMRSHPERDWRGVKPPSDEEKPVDCLRDVISGLVKLSGGVVETFRGSCLTKDQNDEARERTKLVDEKGNSDKAKMVETECSESDEEDYVQVEANNNGSEDARDLKRKRYLSLGDLNGGEDDNGHTPRSTSLCSKKYECSTCNKSFSSKQGLGGHMSSSSHKIKENAREKTSIIAGEDRRGDNNVDSTEYYGALLLMALACNNNLDQFGISNETVDEESNATRRNARKFDLNELPPVDDDDDHS